MSDRARTPTELLRAWRGAGLAGYRRLLPPGNAHLARAEAALQKVRSEDVERTSGGLTPPRPQIK